MSTPRILTLTTDFGSDGPYVAALKGVILALAPNAQLVDVSHRIAPQNILEGAFMLASIIDVFPQETVHLAVVDPCVGTERKLVALRVAGQWLVAPDNGVLTGVLHGPEPDEIWEITSPSIRRNEVSHTFHGRDLLAPAAAHLLLGRPASELGMRLNDVVRLANFEPRETDQGLLGEVIFRDTFGNLISNIRAERLAARPAESWTIEIAGQRVHGLSRTYGERPHGELVAVTGSSGWLEVAVVNGDAARQLGAASGTTVWVHAGASH